jgi:hypothetical protein
MSDTVLCDTLMSDTVHCDTLMSDTVDCSDSAVACCEIYFRFGAVQRTGSDECATSWLNCYVEDGAGFLVRYGQQCWAATVTVQSA